MFNCFNQSCRFGKSKKPHCVAQQWMPMQSGRMKSAVMQGNLLRRHHLYHYHHVYLS